MEEQNKETEEQKSSQENSTTSKRSAFLMIFAGIYLLYTGYTLCKGVLDGQEGSHWGFFAAGAAFLVIAVVMLFQGIKSYNAIASARKNQKASSDENSQGEEGFEETDSAQAALGSIRHQEAAAKKTMSISERANLANRLEDAAGTEEETEAHEK